MWKYKAADHFLYATGYLEKVALIAMQNNSYKTWQTASGNISGDHKINV